MIAKNIFVADIHDATQNGQIAPTLKKLILNSQYENKNAINDTRLNNNKKCFLYLFPKRKHNATVPTIE